MADTTPTTDIRFTNKARVPTQLVLFKEDEPNENKYAGVAYDSIHDEDLPPTPFWAKALGFILLADIVLTVITIYQGI